MQYILTEEEREKLVPREKVALLELKIMILNKKYLSLVAILVAKEITAEELPAIAMAIRQVLCESILAQWVNGILIRFI